MKYHRATADDEMSRSFGFQSVDEDAKQQRVDHVFHRVAKRYDIMNDLMSAGMHRLWKDAMVAWLAPPRHRDWRVLDVAGGTGDIAFRIIEQSDRHAYVDVLDINASMLAVGRERSVRCSLDDLTNFVEANAEALPFADASFDAYTIAFGIRNVPRISAALAEAHRVLKTGGRFLCLEFSDVEMPFLHQVYESWSFAAIPRIGSLVTGSAEPYQYLVESIRRFPNQSDFAAMITAAGFDRVDWRNLSGGIAALHSGWKL